MGVCCSSTKKDYKGKDVGNVKLSFDNASNKNVNQKQSTSSYTSFPLGAKLLCNRMSK